MTDSTIAPAKNSDFRRRPYHSCSAQGRILLKKRIHIFFCVQKVYRSMTSRCRGTPNFRRYDRVLVVKSAMSLKQSWEGYREKTSTRNSKQPNRTKAQTTTTWWLLDVPYPLHWSPSARRAGLRPLDIPSWLLRCNDDSPIRTPLRLLFGIWPLHSFSLLVSRTFNFSVNSRSTHPDIIHGKPPGFSCSSTVQYFYSLPKTPGYPNDNLPLITDDRFAGFSSDYMTNHNAACA